MHRPHSSKCQLPVCLLTACFFSPSNKGKKDGRVDMCLSCYYNLDPPGKLVLKPFASSCAECERYTPLPLPVPKATKR